MSSEKNVSYICFKKKDTQNLSISKKNGMRNHLKIGRMIGYPKSCVDAFAKRSNKYGYSINISYGLKGEEHRHRGFLTEQAYFFKCNVDKTKHVTMMRRKFEREIKKNLLPLFHQISISQDSDIV